MTTPEDRSPETMDQTLIRQIVEAALLAAPQPLTLAQLAGLFPEDEPAPNGVDKVSQAPGLILANWRDSFTAAIGMNYRWNDKLTLRTGYKFDLTPIRSPEYRHPSAPDSNRHMFSIGANYKLRKHMSVDLAYSLIMLEDAESRYRDPCRGAFLEDEDGFTSDKPQDCTGNGGTFRGKFQDTFINTIGVQLNTRM